ncbi:MAG: hypothetical protein QOD66_3890 [Solirubrobacteraceae bacterium]|nr:hypothetical protein [Solirubrobacteraceae bacterium]
MVLASAALSACAGAAALAGSSVAHGGTPCGPAAARTLASGPHARVYASRGVVFGCAAGGARSFRLGGTGSCIGSDRVGPVVVAGEIAAFASERCGIDTGFTLVVVRDLRDGKRLSASAAASSPGPESFTSVNSLVARSDGAVAWIAGASSIGNHMTNVEVHRVDRRGQALLDAGRTIARGSLRLRRSRLTWTHGGQLRSATLV